MKISWVSKPFFIFNLIGLIFFFVIIFLFTQMNLYGKYGLMSMNN